MGPLVVTLTTDFGDADGYAGAMKGVLLSEAPAATLVDITHAVPRHDVVAGAHVLLDAAPSFPPGTIHVAVVDPGVGGARRPVVVQAGGFLFVGPDNGLFSLVAPHPLAAHEIADARFQRDRVSSTFHGRDVFAVAAGRLAAGARPDEVGPAIALRGTLALPVGGDCVVHIDGFGNLVTGIDGARLAAGARVRVAGRTIAAGATYESVARGELVACVGSRGTIEIAVREGSAAGALGVARGAPVEIVEP